MPGCNRLLSPSFARSILPKDRTNPDEILSDYSDIDEALEGFDPPARWTYHDDEIPT